MRPKECSNCPNHRVVKAKGLCSACYQRFRRGTVESARLAHREANKKYRLTHPNYRKSRQGIERRRRYGLSNEDYNSLLEKSKGLCQICQEPSTKMCIDHDHLTGTVRGLLCDRCNKALGFYEYLMRYRTTLEQYLKF